MKEIVWVFGTSSAGKETFIRNAPQDGFVRSELGWQNKEIAISHTSLNYIGQYKDDPIVENRLGILKETEQLLRDSDVVLIKWQIVDSEADIPNQLAKLFPEAAHRIILLSTPMSELSERLTQKPWWHDYGHEDEYLADEVTIVGNIIANLGAEFTVIKISSSKGEHYTLLS